MFDILKRLHNSIISKASEDVNWHLNLAGTDLHHTAY